MKNIITCILIALVVCAGISCKSKEKIDIKTAEKEISSDINRLLEEAMMDLGLSAVKLKTAPKKTDALFIGTVTYISGSSKFDQEILVNFDSDTKLLTWCYSDYPENISFIYLGEPIYQMTNESPGYSPEMDGQSFLSTENKQTTNSQPTETLGKVEQKGSTFTTFDSRGRQITYFSQPYRELVGWGRDFFVIKQGTTFYTYDSRCKQISSITVGGATSATVDADSFTIKVGSSTQKYNRSCKRY